MTPFKCAGSFAISGVDGEKDRVFIVLRTDTETRLLELPSWHDNVVSPGVAISQATWNKDAIVARKEYTIQLEALRSSGLPGTTDLLASISGKTFTHLGEPTDRGIYEVNCTSVKADVQRRLDRLKEDFAEFCRTGTIPPDTEFPQEWFTDRDLNTAIKSAYFRSSLYPNVDVLWKASNFQRTLLTTDVARAHGKNVPTVTT